jgi:hypothetical protein
VAVDMRELARAKNAQKRGKELMIAKEEEAAAKKSEKS